MIASRSVGSLLVACLCWLPASAWGGETEIIAADAYWRFLDDGSDPGPFWAFSFFDSSGWPFGRAQLGYGDGDETTTLSFGPGPEQQVHHHLLPSHLSGNGSERFGPLDLRIRRDDGAVVYLNGIEVWRSNLPGGQIFSTTHASPAGSTENRVYEVAIPTSLLFAGGNVLAVEIHQSGPTSSDLSMEATLTAASPTPPAITRGPYLQMGTDSSVSVLWRTDVPHPTRLRYRGSGPKLDQPNRRRGPQDSTSGHDQRPVSRLQRLLHPRHHRPACFRGRRGAPGPSRARPGIVRLDASLGTGRRRHGERDSRCRERWLQPVRRGSTGCMADVRRQCLPDGDRNGIPESPLRHVPGHAARHYPLALPSGTTIR